MKRPSVLLATAGLALAIAASVLAEPPNFELTVVPPLDTQVGELAFFQAWSINDKGQVAGEAHDGDFNPSAAARYSAARGIEDLDPDGEYNSMAWAINGKGQVLGFIEEGPFFFQDIFLHSPGGGFDFLEKGKTDEIVQGFIPGFGGRGALPRSGNVFGTVLTFTNDATRAAPYIYTKRGGWTDLSGVHPRFADEKVAAAYTNEKGYLVFVISGSSPPGEKPPTGRQEVFVRSPRGRVHELVGPGRPVTPGSRPNRRGRMAGLYLTDDAKEQAYIFTPATGLVDIHPAGYKESVAHGVNNKGAAYGMLRENRAYDQLFIHTEQRGLEVVVSRGDLDELAEGHQGTFESVYPEDMNERREIVGCVHMRRGPDVPFLYSPDHGLIDLSEVVEGEGLRTDGCGLLINNKSQTLLHVREGGRSTAAILKLVG